MTARSRQAARHLPLEEPLGMAEVTGVDVYYEEGTPKFLGANSLGVARAPERG